MNSVREYRRKILDMALEIKKGHIASAMSVADIMFVLYQDIMTNDDKFILSKGHGCLALYVMLRDKGLNPKLLEHPDIDVKNGIECTTGSLGHGLPVAVGMAFAKKLKKEKGNIYVIISDGEMQEGVIWESLLLASHHKLDNLTVIVDYNKLQALGFIEDILSLDNLANKITAFNCTCIEVFDGHDIDKLKSAFKDDSNLVYHEPKVIVAHTIKGKGLSCMENKPEWHHKIPEGNVIRKCYEEL